MFRFVAIILLLGAVCAQDDDDDDWVEVLPKKLGPRKIPLDPCISETGDVSIFPLFACPNDVESPIQEESAEEVVKELQEPFFNASRNTTQTRRNVTKVVQMPSHRLGDFAEKVMEKVRAEEAAAEGTALETNNASEVESSVAAASVQSTSDNNATIPPISEEIMPNDVVVELQLVEKDNSKFNFASQDCGAKIVSVNKEAEGVGAVLGENKDKYMLNPCHADRWVIIDLCEHLMVESLQVANYEFFSCTFAHVELYGAGRYKGGDPENEAWEPMGRWDVDAEHTDQVLVVNTPVWAKHVLVRFRGQSGSEYYCPVSVIRVFGRTGTEELSDLFDEDVIEVDRISRNMGVVISETKPNATDGDAVEDGGDTAETNNQSVPLVNATHANVTAHDKYPFKRTLDGTYKRLSERIKRVEVNLTIVEGFLHSMSDEYGEAFKEHSENARVLDVGLQDLRRDLDSVAHELFRLKENTEEGMRNQFEAQWRLLHRMERRQYWYMSALLVVVGVAYWAGTQKTVSWIPTPRKYRGDAQMPVQRLWKRKEMRRSKSAFILPPVGSSGDDE